MNDKRNWSRVTWTTPVETTHPETKEKSAINARLRDISKTGFAMVSEERLTRGLEYDFVVNKKVDPLHLRGQVVHIQNEGTYFIVGVRLATLSLAQKSRFNRFMMNHSEKLKKMLLAYSFIGGIAIWSIFQFVLGTSFLVGFASFATVTILLYALKPF